jgi:arsenate reductase
MESESAIVALGAWRRARAWTCFVCWWRHEPAGLGGGEIARQLDVPQNTMSAHLGILARAGRPPERHSRSIIIYRADLGGCALTLFLVKDCCAATPNCASRSSPNSPPAAERSPMSGLTAVDIVIYHNPECGTSRNTLAMIRNAGIEPHVVEYLKTPPSRAMLVELIERPASRRATCCARRARLMPSWARRPALSDEALVDAMMAHPILINRPLVVSPLGVKLCRPSEAVLDLLPSGSGAFAKEDGEQVVDAFGERVAGHVTIASPAAPARPASAPSSAICRSGWRSASLPASAWGSCPACSRDRLGRGGAGQSRRRGADLADDRADAAQDRLRRARRSASIGRGWASRCSSTGR